VELTNNQQEINLEDIKKRFNTIESEIRFEFQEEVKDYIVYYLTDQQRNFEIALALYQKHGSLIEKKFAEYLLPKELSLLPFALSGMHNQAITASGGTGIWGLNYYVATKNGLNINAFTDERKDIARATTTSADYLIHLFNKYQSWNMAITAFASSPAIVNKAIMRSGNKQNYWQIRPFLPEDVRMIIPSFFAATYLHKYHVEHGLIPAQINLDIPGKNIKPSNALSVEVLSKKLNVSVQLLQLLNPTFRGDLIPSNFEQPAFVIPENSFDLFTASEIALYEETEEHNKPKKVVSSYSYSMPVIPENSDEITYVVRSGDYLGKIAARYQVGVSTLKYWNGLSSDRIDIGQRLIVYVPEGKTIVPKPAVTAPSEKTTPAPVSSDTPSLNRYVNYTIKEGDTLWNIAKNNPGNSVEDLQKVNKISASIKPGQVIKIKGE
ncbi:MAG: LysM peptidoglycan-binding domain-containing protein, partial [Cyclobacteriaceae bacterium]|nr:LysM peptidoglycan-binding domain-containing protein [Cyclobacteriaceae bacterium]